VRFVESDHAKAGLVWARGRATHRLTERAFHNHTPDLGACLIAAATSIAERTSQSQSARGM